DSVGYSRVTALANGNYVVRTPGWDRGAIADAGAVTLGDGTTGVSGVITPLNSLVGGAAGDEVGYGAIPLANSNYVILSPYRANGTAAQAGAVTWASGISGIVGEVSAANSLVGSTANGEVGAHGV